MKGAHITGTVAPLSRFGNTNDSAARTFTGDEGQARHDHQTHMVAKLWARGLEMKSVDGPDVRVALSVPLLPVAAVHPNFP